ncbi:MAG: rubrerythrin family protein [Alphaproteobacteria bacterium]|nr:rubrerythrin family protein [Alphaproteobacteria bacterium]
MSKSIKGTQTEKNILTAFAGESQARNRYTFFASQAKKDGYVQIQKLFEETAAQEKEHAERLFKFLEGGDVEISASYPAGKIGTTEENLSEAAAGEHYEHTEMYPAMADVADAEGFPEIAAAMRNIAEAERHHETRYLSIIKELQNDSFFKKDKLIMWECLNCGYWNTAIEPPAMCPACAHEKAYFAPNRSWIHDAKE